MALCHPPTTFQQLDTKKASWEAVDFSSHAASSGKGKTDWK